jgi:hypothetical protein
MIINTQRPQFQHYQFKKKPDNAFFRHSKWIPNSTIAQPSPVLAHATGSRMLRRKESLIILQKRYCRRSYIRHLKITLKFENPSCCQTYYFFFTHTLHELIMYLNSFNNTITHHKPHHHCNLKGKCADHTHNMWKLALMDYSPCACGATCGNNGVTCSRLGSVGSVCNRWQCKLGVRWIAYKSREFECRAERTAVTGIVFGEQEFLKRSLRYNFNKGKTMLSLLKVCESCIE